MSKKMTDAEREEFMVEARKGAPMARFSILLDILSSTPKPGHEEEAELIHLVMRDEIYRRACEGIETHSSLVSDGPVIREELDVAIDRLVAAEKEKDAQINIISGKLVGLAAADILRGGDIMSVVTQFARDAVREVAGMTSTETLIAKGPIELPGAPQAIVDVMDDELRKILAERSEIKPMTAEERQEFETELRESVGTAEFKLLLKPLLTGSKPGHEERYNMACKVARDEIYRRVVERSADAEILYTLADGETISRETVDGVLDDLILTYKQIQVCGSPIGVIKKTLSEMAAKMGVELPTANESGELDTIRRDMLRDVVSVIPSELLQKTKIIAVGAPDGVNQALNTELNEILNERVAKN